MELKGSRVLVVGLGESGLSMAKWLSRHGARVRVADSRPNPPGQEALRQAVPNVELHLGGWRDEDFDDADLIAISPGVPRETPQVAKAVAAGKEVVGDVELFARTLPTHNRPKIIAITGTNGKTTVTALTGALCRAAGLDCEVAGNISPAVLDALMAREDSQRHGGQPADAWVLELSSFQLESTHSLGADAAAMLNLTEDHLDRHGSMREYGMAKQRIFEGRGVQVLNRDDPASVAMALPGRRVLTFGTGAPSSAEAFGLVRDAGRLWLAQGGARLLATDEMQLAGLHNAANALASLALCRAIGLPFEPLLGALRAFRGLPHRVEFVAEVKGARYYDDSKGTNVGSTVAALAGLSGTLAPGAKVVLIAGGEGKGQNFSPLADVLTRTARAVVLIGRDAPLIEKAIEKAIAGAGVPLSRAPSMQAAVDAAAAEAQPGDAVLLSPACASFDMFRDYKHRGEVFTALVKERAHV